MSDLKAHPAAFEKLRAFVDGSAGLVRAPFAVLLAILNLSIIALSLGIWTVEADIDPKDIRLENGVAYVVSPIPGRPIFPFGIRGDALSAPNVSSLRVAENGRPLGPAHALHEDIRRWGQGAFSHWEGMLIFSTPDGSDARSNGRTYRIEAIVTFRPLVQGLILLVTAFTIFLERKRLAVWLPARGDVVLAGLGAAVGIIMAVVAWGLLPTINANAGPLKDWSLVVGVLLHIGIGAGLFAAMVVTGVCATMLVLCRRDVAPSEAALIGYPIGLAITVMLAAVAVVVPGGRWLASILLIMTWLPAAFWRPAVGELADMGLTVARCAAPAAGFAAFMALLWHGPTATLSASTLGDLVHSYASVHMLTEHPYPFWHLGSEGDLMPYENMAPMAIAAALIVFPGFDGMLFLTASLAMFFSLWLALGLVAVRRAVQSDPAEELGGLGIAVVIALVLAGSRTPSFVVESPPIAFALPLLFSISYLAWKSSGDVGSSLLTAIGATVGAALSKVVLLLPLGLLAGVDAAVHLKDHRPTRSQTVLTAITCLAVAAYVLRTVAIWAPTYLSTFVPGPDSRIWLFDYGRGDLPALTVVVARDVGWCLLGVGVVRMGTLRLTIAYWVAVLANFAYPYLFHTAAIYAVLLVAISLLIQPDRYHRAPHPLAVGAVLLVAYPLTRDWSGAQAGIIWLLCITPIAWLAIIGGRRHDALTRWVTNRIGPVTAVGVALSLIAVGSGIAIVDSGWRQGKPDVLTPGMYDIWGKVREMTPSDALIFTDLTGPEFRVASGWDSYAAAGERQVFISSWVTSFRRFRIDPAARAERFCLNQKVLDGEIDPSSVPLTRKYGSYFAVMQNEHPAPANFESIYRNQELTLYRINRR